MTAPAVRTSIATDSAYSLALKLSLYVTGFGASILISRVLGPTGRGLYYLPVVTAATVAALCTLGLEQANVFLFGNARATVERLWTQSGLVALAMGVLGAAATLAAPLVMPGLYSATPLSLLLLAGLTIPFSLHTQLAAGLLTLRGQVTWQFRAGLAGALLQVAVLVALFIAGRLGVASVLAAGLAGTATTWGLMARRGRPGQAPWAGWDGPLLAETLRQSIPLHLASVFLFLHLRLDMFMVSGMLGATALGIYSLAVTLAETVLLATDSLSIAILPRQVGNTLAEASTMALRGTRANAVVGLVLASGWWLLGVPIVGLLFGRAFVPACWPLSLLLPGIVCLGMQRVCGGAVLRSGRPWWIVGIQGGSLACNAVLNVWLIPALGPGGAGLASTLSYALGTVLFLSWTARLGGLRFVDALPGADDVRAIWRSGRGLCLALIPTRGARAGE
jgi:stage V sporulation protein B